ncbi:M16 family metallopeptidase [Crossiella cryophila]|uniref:Putative Zn-dependent peptidase n=1 Tax=Crossiella cryophila TaxID=43355 RepID=A0A7W7FTN9_9PSEU|nr:pitrilysin family protein [Crossiella cryophila]MBB4678381.1 putative Zn-dependent peptidase [Crossiella cryophila]
MRRDRLGNGLTVLLAPVPEAARVAVSVHYRVGFRNEPEQAAGFAHLFEHLMFEGSAEVGPREHGARVHATGGAGDARTHQDYTRYFQVLPSQSLELALFLEADRMRAPRFTEAGIQRQLAGVAEEIRLSVRERPYGGFPWPRLPQALYRDFANAHDGFGDTTRLAGITPEQCREFFGLHYPPGNAVLTVCGDFDPGLAWDLINRHFGDIPARPVPPVARLTEQLRQASTIVLPDRRISLPGLAIGYPLPDPATELPAYLAHQVLAPALRWPAELSLASDSSCGFFDYLDAADPDTLVLTAVHRPQTQPEALLSYVDRRLSTVAGHGLPRAEFERHRDRLRLEHHRRHADLLTRCCALGRLEILFGRAELLDDWPGLLDALPPDSVPAAAERLRASPRGVLHAVPDNGR